MPTATETKAKWVYTNADQLRNKVNELDILISQENPDFIFVTEVLPKSTVYSEVSCSSVLYNINGYEAFPSQDGGRGVMIYARTGLNVSVNEQLNSLYYDASWCNWKCDNLKIIVGSVYRSPNANDLGQCLKDVISEDSTMCDKILITGDFNMKDIDWHSYSTIHSDEHIEHVFIECLRDNFLYQHVFEPTRFRENQTCNTLDLVISREEEDIQNLQINPSLGVSDHATIIFDFICTYKEVQNSSVKMQYSKCDTQGFEAEWETIDWDEKFKDLD